MTSELQNLKTYLSQAATTEDFSDPQAAFAENVFKHFFLAARSRRPVSRLDPIVEELAEGIQHNPDVFRASQAAIVCGTLVEYGANPAIAAGACVSRLSTAAPLMQEFLQCKKGQTPSLDSQKAMAGAQFLILPLMTMLSRAVEERIRARSKDSFTQAIFDLAKVDKKDEVPYLPFLLSLMETYDGGLTLVFPQLSSAMQVRVEAVQNNFHLFSLIQANLGQFQADLGIESYLPIDPNLKDYIHGNPYQQADLPKKDAARHGFADLSAWNEMAQGKKALTGFIPGEAYPYSIPKLGPNRILLISKDPLFGSRSWDLQFFPPLHDALRTRFESMEILTGPAFQQLSNEIQKAAGQSATGKSKPWWKRLGKS